MKWKVVLDKILASARNVDMTTFLELAFLFRMGKVPEKVPEIAKILNVLRNSRHFVLGGCMKKPLRTLEEQIEILKGRVEI